VLHAMRLLLVHDIIEIDAGDAPIHSSTFAKALDRLQPLLLNLMTEGGGTWTENAVTEKQVVALRPDD